MSSDCANGSTLQFGGSPVGKITDMTFSENGAEVDVSDFSKTYRQFLAGLTTYEMNVTVNGIPATAIGATGQISVAWNNGTTDTATGINFILLKKERTGTLDSTIKTTLGFKPYGG